MGMFDYVICEYPLPENAPKYATGAEFQTKDTDAQYLETYVITKEGRLIHKAVKYESVPENERPYYGRPEWDKGSLFRIAGSMRTVPIGDVDTNYHGDLTLSCSNKDWTKFCNFTVRFTNGNVQSFDVDNPPEPLNEESNKRGEIQSQGNRVSLYTFKANVIDNGNDSEGM